MIEPFTRADAAGRRRVNTVVITKTQAAEWTTGRTVRESCRQLIESRVLWHLVVLGAVSSYVFYRRRDLLFWHLDGLSAFQLIEAQHRWLPFSTSLGLDPYRGPGNLFAAINFRLLPAFSIQQLVLSGRVGRAATFTYYSCQSFLLICLLARRLNLPSVVGVLGGWLFALLVTPLIWTNRTTLLFPIFPLAPSSFEVVTFVVLFFVSFIEIGRLGTVASSLLTVFCLCLSLWFAAACPVTAVSVVPFLIVLFIASTILGSARERACKATAVLLVAGALWVSGAVVYVYGFMKGSPVSFFGSEIETYQSGLWWSSMAYQLDRFPAGLVLVATSLAAALLILARRRTPGNRRLVCAAAIHCVLAAGMLLSWPVVERTPILYAQARHARLFYFELPMLPFFVLFSAVAIAFVTRSLDGHSPTRPTVVETLLAGVIALVVLPGARDVGASNPYREPVRQTAITRFLQAHIGLEPGSVFRGRAVSVFQPTSLPNGASWDAMIANDIGMYTAVGNDLRFVGLWAFGIPTLEEYSQIISPGTYFWVTRALSGPNDKQDMRNHALITRVDLPLLRALGIRYVISPVQMRGDSALELVLRDGNHYLYEVPHPNLGQYAATSVVMVRDFSEMFQGMRGTADLLGRTFVSDDLPSGLVPATVEIRVQRGGLRVHGTSEGVSLAVLPFTFSRCYTVSNDAKSSGARLIRVNLSMLGLLFTKTVDATLDMSSGLFHRSNCTLMDVRDYERLGLARVVSAIPRGGLVSKDSPD